MLYNHWFSRLALLLALALVFFTACTPKVAKLVDEEQAIDYVPPTIDDAVAVPEENPDITPPNLPTEGSSSPSSSSSSSGGSRDDINEDSGLDAFGSGEGVNPPSIPN